jgi:hypothetical protein
MNNKPNIFALANSRLGKIDVNRYRNTEEIPRSQENSPDNSPDNETVPTVPGTIKYIIYCHGELTTHQIVIPHLIDNRAITLETLIDDFNVLIGDQYNMINICNENYLPRTINKSGDTVYDMNLIGGVPIGVDLGIYLCTELNDEPYNVCNFTQVGNEAGIIFTKKLSEIIEYIARHHLLYYNEHPLRIILHTCRVAQNVPRNQQVMTEHTVNDDLSSYLDNMNINDNNEMDTSGGKKKSKTSRIKKTNKTKKNKKRKKTKNNKKLRK